MLTALDYPQRILLNDEIHARPYVDLDPPERVSYLALLVDAEARRRELDHLANLCARYGQSLPSETGRDMLLDLGDARLKVERHEEFTRYKFIRHEPFVDPFAAPVIERIPADWLAGVPGQLLVATHVAIQKSDEPFNPASLDALQPYFAGHRLIGAHVADGAGEAITDFRVHPDGFGRILIVDRGMAPGQAARTLQRLLEIETYRMLALLALPQARGLLPQLNALDGQLVDLTNALTEGHERLPHVNGRNGQVGPLDHSPAGGAQHSDEALLEELTHVATVVESRISATQSRFNASRAYAEMVDLRLEHLREGRIQGMPTFSEFLSRRLEPAMRTCETADQRLHWLAQRIAHTTQLLVARIDVRREQQNQAVLISMNRRAKLQLRLQQTIEGLSVAAITYYTVSLISYGLKGLKALHVPLDVELITALAIPVVALILAYGLNRLHHAIASAEAGHTAEESALM